MEHITINVSNDLSIYKRYNEGDIIFVPSATTHKVMSLLGNNKVRMIAYNAAILKSTALQIDFSDLLQKREHYVITSQSKGYEEIRHAIDNICSFEGDFSIGGKIRVVSNLLQIVSEIIQQFDLEMKESEKEYARIRPVIEYIEHNYMRKITIAELSTMVHICNDSLFTLFKKATGTTPAKYILNMRIEASIHFLTTTELSLEEIAERTGFGSATYMNRIFRQKLNCTPGKFRGK